MNAHTLEFTRKIRSHIGEIENARSWMEDNGSGSADRALNAIRDAFATIEQFLESTRDKE